ncbi:extensin-like domain-containing protein [Variovorax sp. RHLX14]|uniref:extensin-like domain-containing protein n=1 Tax=Variovorax sp. RHLX14 TaxID=1259731 RepID=UPI003F464DE2
MRWLFLAVFTAAVAAAYAIYSGKLEVPDRYNPWAPLNVTAPPDWLTGMKLARTRDDAALCSAALATTDMQYDTVPDRVTGAGCGFTNAVRLRSAAVRFGPPVLLSCPMALSLYMWERHALQPAAQQRYGQRVAALEHLGSYACRNVNLGEGVPAGASRSRHATADALDIASLTLADGRRISLVSDWKSGNAADKPLHAQFLQDAHAGACRYFKGVLGPDYNAAHRDHFHLETGGYSMCR